MGAYAKDDQPLRFLYTFLLGRSIFYTVFSLGNVQITYTIMLWISQCASRNRFFDGNFGSSPMTNEQWFSSPFERNGFALWNIRQLHFNFSQSQYIGGCAHRFNKLTDYSLGTVGRRNSCSYLHKCIRFYWNGSSLNGKSGIRTSNKQVGERVAIGGVGVFTLQILRRITSICGEVGHSKICMGKSCEFDRRIHWKKNAFNWFCYIATRWL